MANVTEQTLWESGVYQIETSDAVLGGVNGIANKQALQLANRTTWLKAQGIPTHDAALNYPVGAFAKVGAVVYRAISTNINKAPASNPTIWEPCYLTKAEVQTAVDLLGYAPLASPALTGVPTAPTAAVDTSTTQLATTAFVTNQAASTAPIVDGTAAVGTSKRYARADHVHPTDTSRAPVASPALTGTPTAPTATDGTNTTQIANTAFVQSAVGGYLLKSGQTGGTVTLTESEASNPIIAVTGTLTSNVEVIVPATVKRLWAIYNATSGAFTVTVKTTSGTGVTVAQGKRNLVYTDGTNVYDGFNDFENIAITGTSTAPTAAVDTSTTQVASTAFVTNQASATTPIVDGTAAVGTSKRYARGDHVHPTDTSRAPLASPALTGTPTAPTATDGTNTTQIANTAFVQSAVGGYLSKSTTGGTVTLTDVEASNPIIAVTGTLTSNLTVVLPATVKRLWAIYNATSGAYTVTVKLASGTGVTVAQGKRNLVYTDGTNVYDGFNDFENIAITGTSTAPTAAVDTSTTQVATTAFVTNQAASTNPIVNGTAAVGTSKRYARGDHVHPTDTSRAPVASPALTGTPTAPTATDGTNTTQIASTAFVQSAVGGYLLKSGQTGGTVTLTDAEASNPIIAVTGTLTSNLTVVLPATVKRLWAIYNATSGAYTVTVKLASGTGVTVAQGKRNLVYTDGSNVYDGFNDFENVALTGTSTAPTAVVDTSTTQVATTAFVTNQAASTNPIVNGTAAVGTSKRYARADHVHPTDTTRAAVSSFANSKATSGWQKLEGGLIIQWGFAAYNKDNGITGTVANLPIAFPNNVLAAVVSDTGSAVGSFACVPVNSSQIRIWSRNVTVAGAPYETYGCNFIAIGY